MRDFNNIETRAVKFFFFPLLGKAPKEIHAILIETLACFLPGRGKDLPAPLYSYGDCTDGASSAVGSRSGCWVLIKAVALKALVKSCNLTAGTGCENLILKFETNRTPVVPEVNLIKIKCSKFKKYQLTLVWSEVESKWWLCPTELRRLSYSKVVLNCVLTGIMIWELSNKNGELNSRVYSSEMRSCNKSHIWQICLDCRMEQKKILQRHNLSMTDI